MSSLKKILKMRADGQFKETDGMSFVMKSKSETGNPQLRLFGEVGAWWDGNTFDDFEYKLSSLNLKEGDILDLIVDSSGGDMIAGNGIYLLLKNCPAEVHSYGLSEVSSAALTITLAATKRYWMPFTLGVAHNGRMCACFDHIEGKEYVELMSSINETYHQIYADETGTDIDKMSELMDADKTITADIALEYGLITHINDGLSIGNLSSKQISAYSKGNAITAKSSALSKAGMFVSKSKLKKKDVKMAKDKKSKKRVRASKKDAGDMNDVSVLQAKVKFLESENDVLKASNKKAEKKIKKMKAKNSELSAKIDDYGRESVIAKSKSAGFEIEIEEGDTQLTMMRKVLASAKADDKIGDDAVPALFDYVIDMRITEEDNDDVDSTFAQSSSSSKDDDDEFAELKVDMG